MVAQDSPSSDDFMILQRDKENFEKVHDESLFEQETSSEEEMSYSELGRTANETPHAT